MASSSAVQLIAVTKRFGQTVAVDGIDAEIAPQLLPARTVGL
jgi:hypothetical protein